MRAQFEEDRQEVALQARVAGLELDDLHAGKVTQPPTPCRGRGRPGRGSGRPRRHGPEMPGPPSAPGAILSP
ncbi:hypothetical protein GCM10010282_54650 [Streptomyces roseolus]|nr:hypothetical protein GCM10010282_54650 [Streptomyces roseolus]